MPDGLIIVFNIIIILRLYNRNDVCHYGCHLLTRAHISGTSSGVSSGASSGASLRIGLSTTVHGYNTIAPLIHAVVLGCFGLLLMFFVGGDGGYIVHAPQAMKNMPDHSVVYTHVQAQLHKARNLITISVVVVPTFLWVISVLPTL